jgi:beta-galactosidase/beta-glucuronidase
MSAFGGHPKPDFRRADWSSLDGEWDFAFDDGDRGLGESWWAADGPSFPLSIRVPFAYRAPLSGVVDRSRHDILWYRCSFELSESFRGKRVFLHFGAVDYEAQVWVNGVKVAEHRGGSSPFCAEIGAWLRDRRNSLVLRALDSPDCSQPRGKQSWGNGSERVWYTPTSGIWQTVWLEARGEAAIERFFAVPDIDRDRLELEIELDSLPPSGALVSANALLEGRCVARTETEARSRVLRLALDIAPEDPADDSHLWSPEHPVLYDLELELRFGGSLVDRVESQFGMRKLSSRDGRLLLNNRPYEQRLVLDQGYWPEGMMTPPSEESIVRDIELAKSFGFNGARKHQKMEDPRYLYWADRLGFLVWGELPSAYEFGSLESLRLVEEMAAMVLRDRNHPSVAAWVALNESWGARRILENPRQQALAASLRQVALCLDGTRPVSANDGWEQVDTDICAIHDYEATGKGLAKKLADPAALLEGAPQGRKLYAEGYRHRSEPVMLTEFGGIACGVLGPGDWGYNTAAANPQELVARARSLVEAARGSGFLAGFCWTQLTDVEQEVNGLARADRSAKIDPALLFEVFGSRSC